MTLSPQERGKEMYCDGKGDEMLDEINVDAVAKKYTNVTVMMAVTMAFGNINLDRVSSSSHGRGVGAQAPPGRKQRGVIHVSQEAKNGRSTQYSNARDFSKPNLARETEAARRDIIFSL